MKLFNFLVLISAFVLISACQSDKLNPGHTALVDKPNTVDADNDLDKTYLWGGEILDVQNKQNATEITIISYPLDRNEKPQFKKPSNGRFIASYPGFLEPQDYQKGELITILGQLVTFRSGRIEQANYQFPVLLVSQLKSHGYPRKGARLPFSIGIGVGIGL